MRNCLIFITLIVISFSCSKKSAEQETKEVSKDTSKVQIVGADRDSHGCITSAGYTWSVLRNDCVRIFEVGTRLDAVEENTMSAFVVFDAEGNKAELFTIMLKSPIILERKAEGHPWANAEWELSAWKGYVLKKNGKVLFHGK
jgi:hypothetical protein